MTQADTLRHLLSDGTVKRASDLRVHGIRPQAIADALAAGLIERAAIGTYFMPEAARAPVAVGVAAACLRMPRAVVCLMSAAYLCGLTDLFPANLWLALPIGAHGGKPGDVQHKVVRWSFGGAFDVGVVDKEICGVAVRHTGRERTVVDLLRYGERLGMPNAGIVTAKRYVATDGRVADLLATAETLRVPRSTLRVLSLLESALALESDP